MGTFVKVHRRGHPPLNRRVLPPALPNQLDHYGRIVWIVEALREAVRPSCPARRDIARRTPWVQHLTDGPLEELLKRHCRTATMRLHFGSIPSSPDFTPDESWRSLQEPSPWLAQFLALPLGIVAAALVGFLWYTLTPFRDIMSLLRGPFVLLLLYIASSVIHELSHAVVQPMGGTSSRTVLGFWPSKLALYAHYDGEISRYRFIVILLMPLAVLTFLPLVVAALAAC